MVASNLFEIFYLEITLFFVPLLIVVNKHEYVILFVFCTPQIRNMVLFICSQLAWQCIFVWLIKLKSIPPMDSEHDHH